jgi:hypothetical protein
MNLKKFKTEIELALMITKWSPTDNQLLEIARKLKEFKGEPTKFNIKDIVLSVVDDYEIIALEGLDNSDLTTLLLLATKVEK